MVAVNRDVGEPSMAEGEGLRVPCDFEIHLMDVSKRCMEGAGKFL
jgi:hypothetical protein